MNVKVIAFGVAKDILGSQSIAISLPGDKANVADLRQELNNLYPDLCSLKQYFIALNETYAEEQAAIADSDEIVIIPPVSGG